MEPLVTRCDVAIIGGGPAGSITASLIKKYSPHLDVNLFEREQFPRDHVGESLLPVVCKVLDEMGCWDKVEAAGFPVKVGATYRWGSSNDLWDFDFLAGQPYIDTPRPAQYRGQRKSTAFQVDRAVFDQLLLDHARESGVEVREQTQVVKVDVKDDAVRSLVLEDGSRIEAKTTIDASGGSAIMRRALGVLTEEPSALRNIAIWAYWQNAEWAATVGASGTRVQVLSLGWGWIWFIPIGLTRTSIGLVLPAEYYKQSGKTTEELYFEAIAAEESVTALTANAAYEGKMFATKDWSFVAERMAGKNWFLVGEAAGFADPILAAGISMAAVGAWEVATTIAEIDRGNFDPDWLRTEFTRASARRLRSHIMFADFWYTANAHFTDLVEFTRKIAEHSGLYLDGKSAWQWLGTGGFVSFGSAGIGGYNLVAADWLVSQFEGQAPDWSLANNNVFELNLVGAESVDLAIYHPGHIESIRGLSRAGKTLALHGVFAFLIETIRHTQRIDQIAQCIGNVWCARKGGGAPEMANALQALEGLVQDGWVLGRRLPDLPLMNLASLRKPEIFHPNYDNVAV